MKWLQGELGGSWHQLRGVILCHWQALIVSDWIVARTVTDMCAFFSCNVNLAVPSVLGQTRQFQKLRNIFLSWKSFMKVGGWLPYWSVQTIHSTGNYRKRLCASFICSTATRYYNSLPGLLCIRGHWPVCTHDCLELWIPHSLTWTVWFVGGFYVNWIHGESSSSCLLLNVWKMESL